MRTTHIAALLAVAITGTTVGAGTAHASWTPPYDLDAAFKAHPTIRTQVLRQVGKDKASLAEDWIKNGVTAPITEHSGIHYGFACKPHDCGDNQITAAWNDEGTTVWSRTVVNGKETVNGSPNVTIRKYLTTP